VKDAEQTVTDLFHGRPGDFGSFDTGSARARARSRARAREPQINLHGGNPMLLRTTWI